MKRFLISGVMISSCLIFPFLVLSQNDSVIVRVHFLHGSKPKRAFRKTEDKWFGGILGGHVGVEIAPNEILNFVPKARFHFFTKHAIINSRFVVHDTTSFYGILGGHPDSVRKTLVAVKVSPSQKRRLDSVAMAYRKRSPYDYAFFGMRCGAAAYDVLAKSGVVKDMGFTKTWTQIFYPRKLRRKLERGQLAQVHSIKKQDGSNKRVWEKN